jgi:hypothetical protein
LKAVIPYPTDYRINEKQKFIAVDLIPTTEALNNLSLALKEYLGILVMKWY